MSRAMRAAVLPAHGAVPVFRDFEDPTPADGQEVLTVLAGGLNPVDIRIAGGNFPSERREPPYVPGKEGIGRREDGTREYLDSSDAPFGSFAERTLNEASHGIPIPDGLDEGVAVSLGIAGLAAWLGLEWRGELQPGETVLVLGASGVVGQIAVQAARLLGAGRVVAAARSAGGLERATALGADATVRLGEDGDLTAAFTEAAGGGIDVVIDPLWGEPAVAALAALNRFGRHVQLGHARVGVGEAVVIGREDRVAHDAHGLAADRRGGNRRLRARPTADR